MSDELRTGTFCLECGEGVDIDEDGLCAMCGATAVGHAVEVMLSCNRVADEAIATLTAERDRLLSDCATRDDRIALLSAERKGLIADRNRLAAEVETLHGNIDAMQDERRNLRGEVERLRKQLDDVASEAGYMLPVFNAAVTVAAQPDGAHEDGWTQPECDLVVAVHAYQKRAEKEATR